MGIDSKLQASLYPRMLAQKCWERSQQDEEHAGEYLRCYRLCLHGLLEDYQAEVRDCLISAEETGSQPLVNSIQQLVIAATGKSNGSLLDHYGLGPEFIICIDGPAGAGKSSVARELAKRLGFGFIETGLYYRAVTYAALKNGLDPSNTSALIDIANKVDVQLRDNDLYLDAANISSDIRSLQVTVATQHAADSSEIRNLAVIWQRKLARGGSWVTEGSRQAEDVFPNAQCKFVLLPPKQALAASARVAEARRAEFTQDDAAVLNAIDPGQLKRGGADNIHSNLAADDSIPISTDDRTAEEVLQSLLSMVILKMRSLSEKD